MKKWLLRKHKGSLEESMATLKKFYTLYDLISYIAIINNCDIKDIKISIYDFKPDQRINWSYTYIVCIKNIPYGFCTNEIDI